MSLKEFMDEKEDVLTERSAENTLAKSIVTIFKKAKADGININSVMQDVHKRLKGLLEDTEEA